MKDPLEELLQPGSPTASRFSPTSRYHGVPTARRRTADGRTVVYLTRRFVPPPERFEDLREHVVTEGERTDHVAARHLGDPEQFWRLADANGAMDPEELTDEAGRRLRITLPEGIPGAPDG